MKKAVIILAITTVFFFCQWIGAIKEHYDRMEERCRCYAEDAAGHMANYVEFRDINDDSYIGQYWGSVAIFYAFMDTLLSLPDNGGWNKLMYDRCSVLYDHMLLAPDEVLAHLDEVLAAMELVGEDFTAPEARRAMNDLSYNLQYVWE